MPLFLGALLGGIAYAQSYEIQWSNFASLLIAGALVFAGFSMLWALVDLFSASRRGNRAAVYFVLLLPSHPASRIDELLPHRWQPGIAPTRTRQPSSRRVRRTHTARLRKPCLD
ncbi:MAG: hypothetical protein IPL57_01425 [Rubrivivax sp.]|nr:hypothetical protein [Rubrivivax sp.]